MATIASTFWRDGNRIPITTDGVISQSSKVLTGNNTTVAVPIFTVTGMIEVRGIWATVTTVLGANHTASAFRLNDGSNTPAITLSTGTDISAAPVGSDVVKKGLAAAAVTYLKSDQARVSEPTTLETIFFSNFVIDANGAATTNVEYVYATTDAPTSGAMTFYMRWLPLLTSSTVTAL